MVSPAATRLAKSASSSSLPLLVLSLPVTWLGRRGWTRRLLACAPILAALGLVSVAVLPASQLPATAAVAFLSGLGGAAFWILGDPILAGSTPPPCHTHIFALKFFVWIAGMAVGGAFGGWLPALLSPFGLAPAQSLAGTLLLLAVLDVTQAATFWSLPLSHHRSAAPSRADNQPATPIPWRLLLLLTVPEICVAIGYGSIKPYLSLFLVEGQGFATSVTGTTFAVAAAAGGLGTLALPGLIGRIGSLPAIVACRFVGSAAIGGWFIGLGAPLLVALICLNRRPSTAWKAPTSPPRSSGSRSRTAATSVDSMPSSGASARRPPRSPAARSRARPAVSASPSPSVSPAISSPPSGSASSSPASRHSAANGSPSPAQPRDGPRGG